LRFDIAELGFQQALIAFNVLLMGPQTRNPFFIHNDHPRKISFVKRPFLDAVGEAYLTALVEGNQLVVSLLQYGRAAMHDRCVPRDWG
jgi:hypothetical protein